MANLTFQPWRSWRCRSAWATLRTRRPTRVERPSSTSRSGVTRHQLSPGKQSHLIGLAPGAWPAQSYICGEARSLPLVEYHMLRGVQPYLKNLTRLVVTVSDKRSSLLQVINNYNRKSFMIQAPHLRTFLRPYFPSYCGKFVGFSLSAYSNLS